ncbi:MAG: LapA family protein [Xanthobacteraceae bacterium]
MSREPRSSGGVLRKIVAAVILIPLAIVIIAFAVANRQIVTVSLDPFSSEHPATSLTLPLFVLVIGLLIAGVLIGGAASWLRHGHLRRTARRFERDIRELRSELASLRHTPSGSARVPETAKPPERLQLRPPVQ